VAQLDAAHAGVGAAQATLEVTQAQVTSAEAQVRQKQAAVEQAQVDLRNTYIRAPVDGIVVSRNVDVGQTVAASLQAPTLFLIAQDLTKMQVDTNVDEADISRVSLDQEASFTVDSYPSLTFRGRVVQIRQAPQVVQNVVTYNTVVAVANPELKLKPGMTANVKILVARRENAVLIANAAFRVRVDGTAPGGAAGQRPAARTSQPGMMAPMMPPMMAGGRGADGGAASRQQPAARGSSRRQAGGAAGSDRIERRSEDRDPGGFGRRRGNGGPAAERGRGWRGQGTLALLAGSYPGALL
jgi:HlyD family secretion protein